MLKIECKPPVSVLAGGFLHFGFSLCRIFLLAELRR